MSANTTFSYVGQRYRQGGSSLVLVSFCATANDIKRWGGVPSKQTVFHGGFQRALGDRYKAIKSFFDDGQASPTSIVVAFREGVVNVSPLGYPNSWAAPGNLALEPDFVHLTFDVDTTDPATQPLDVLRAQVVEMLRTRLTASARAGAVPSPAGDDAEEELGSSDEIESDGEGESDDASEDVSTEIDVGHSKLQSFFDFISDDTKVAAYLSAEQKARDDVKVKERKTRAEREALSASPEEELKFLLASLLRPAMIVDGQHRVWGAYESDKSPITFSVCAICDADWVEQVFQFVVLNRLARPISPSFLTSILNTSLTNEEVGTIERRLENVGIRNTDRVIMKYLNHDDRSPFYQLIAEPSEVKGIDNRGKLSDKGMIRLAKRWFNIKKKKKEMEMFQRTIDAKNLTLARKQWGNHETWVPYFYEFWNAVRAKYERDGLWEKIEGSHLLYIVTMHAMQDMFIDAKAAADARFTNLEDFRSQVDSYFDSVPSTFFRGWKATGLQSGDGPQYIKDAIKDLRDGVRFSTLQENSPLFKVV